MKTYRYMDTIALPEPIEALGLEAGMPGLVDSVSRTGEGTLLLAVDLSGPERPSSAIVEIEVLPDGTKRVVGHSKL